MPAVPDRHDLPLAAGRRWTGPGGQDIHLYDGQHIIAYHVYDRDNNGAAVLRIATLAWDAQGWPFLQ